ncbi:hypothetical protein ACOMHN_052961 [Nucella lapillus]
MATGRQDVRCDVCLEPYGGRGAKLLPCFHFFCQPCLERLVTRRDSTQTSDATGQDEKEGSFGSLTCPTCRRVIPLPPGGVAAFMDNPYLDSVSGEADSGAVACTVCEADQTAQFLCGQCHNHVCCQCQRYHDKCCQGSQLTPLTPLSRSSSEAQSASQSVIQSAAQSVTQSAAQSVTQSAAQSVTQSAVQMNWAVLTQALQAFMGSMVSSDQASGLALGKEPAGLLPLQDHRGAMSSAQASPRNLNDLYQKVEDLAGQVTSLQSANTQLTLHVDLLSSTHNKLSTDHCVLKREVTSLREKNDQLTGGQASLQREVRALRDKQVIAHQDLAVLTAEKDKACAGLAKLQTDILSMQTDASLQQTDILRLKADQTAEKDKACAGLAKLQTDILSMQTYASLQQTDILRLKADHGQVAAKLSTLQTDTATMQTDIQTYITAMKADITGMHTDITGIKSDITDIQTDTKALQGGEASVKKDVDQLKTDWGQLTSDLATIQGKLTALESRFGEEQACFSSVFFGATANTQVGFAARLTQIVTTSKEQTLVCDGIATNEGGGYDGHTGVFTAPVTGTYCFLVTTSPDDRDVKKAAILFIVVDGEGKGAVYSDGRSRSTGHVVVKLTCGQKVWLTSWGGRQCTFGGWCTRFSGMLLQAEV